MKVAAIIVCAGRGKRLGAHQDKAIIKLAGRPLFYHTFKVFEGLKEISEIALVLRKQHFAYARTLIATKKPLYFVEGGKERQDSVMHGLAAVSADVTHVLIHDGARPFASKEMILRVIRALKTHPAVICAVKAKDTLKIVRGAAIVGTLERDRVYCAQTPQGFNKDLIMQAYQRLGNKTVFDDAQAVEHMRKKVYIVEGENSNFKITYPQEVLLADAIIAGKL